MKIDIEKSWKEPLQDEFQKPYFKELMNFVEQEYQFQICYPKSSDIFKAFEYCPFHKLKVVILGQDPYHGPNQAHGLSFSVLDGVKWPPSLHNIFKELQSDLSIDLPASGNLSPWAKQGVLLLNATLSVRAHQAGSHQKKGWELFTDAVIQQISKEKKGVVFILWGSFAQSKRKYIDTEKHHIISSAHPSPLSAYRGFWGSKPFSATNRFLKSKGLGTINWSL